MLALREESSSWLGIHPTVLKKLIKLAQDAEVEQRVNVRRGSAAAQYFEKMARGGALLKGPNGGDDQTGRLNSPR